MGLVIGRPPETDDELWETVRALWGVTLPRTPVCPDHVPPFVAFADAYFGRNSVNPEHGLADIALWHGSRGLSGKSYMLAVLGLTKAVLLGADVNLLGGSFEQSKNIHIHMRNSWDWELAPRYMVAHDGAMEVRLTNKAKIRPLTASQRTVRGPHPAFLLLDEIDEMDLDILDAALGQPMPNRNWLGKSIKPYTVMCSTWQNPEGTFTAIMRRAEEKHIPVYQWCYKETSNEVDGWLSQETIDGKRAMIPKAMWDAEYDLGEPAIGNRAFDTEAVDKVFSLPFEPIEKREAKDFEEYRFEKPVRDGEYIAAADWGKEQDYTIIMVGRTDVYPHRLVYYMRVNRRPYPQMIGWFNEAINAYGARAIHDGTGLGNVVHDLVDLRARKFIMTGEKRSSMLSEYVSAVEQAHWRFPKITSAYLEMKYCRVADLYRTGQDFHLPDSVCAGGLMQLLNRRSGTAKPPILIPRNHAPTALAKHFATPGAEDEEKTALSPIVDEQDLSFVV